MHFDFWKLVFWTQFPENYLKLETYIRCFQNLKMDLAWKHGETSNITADTIISYFKKFFSCALRNIPNYSRKVNSSRRFYKTYPEKCRHIMGVSLVNAHFQLVADKSLFLTLKTTTTTKVLLCFWCIYKKTRAFYTFNALYRVHFNWRSRNVFNLVICALSKPRHNFNNTGCNQLMHVSHTNQQTRHPPQNL